MSKSVFVVPNLIQCDKEVHVRKEKMSAPLSQCISKSVFRMIKHMWPSLRSHLDLLHIQVLLI